MESLGMEGGMSKVILNFLYFQMYWTVTTGYTHVQFINIWLM